MTSKIDNEATIAFPEGVRRPERQDKYVYTYFTETSHPELVLPARQVHAKSYVSERFVHPGALQADGTLSSEIDKARGPNVHYYLGAEMNEGGQAVPRATVRKIDVGFEETIEDLPAFALAQDTFYPEALEFLRGISHPHQTLKEISAYGNTPEVTGMAGLEAIRNLLQDGIDSRETWVFTMVQKSFKTLQRFFSPAMMQQIGDPFAIDDENVNKDIRLVLGMVETDKFLQQIYESHLSEANERAKEFYKQGLLYLTEGLTKREMGESVAAFVEVERGTESPNRRDDTRGLGFEALIGSLQREVAVWQQPERFDLGSIADRREVDRRIENGSITSTFQARNVLADDLFDLQYPTLTKDESLRRAFIEFSDAQGIRFGPWFHMPWDGSLVQYPEQPDHQGLRTMRNRGFDTLAEQAGFLRAKLLVSGLSVGSETLDLMLRGGIGGSVMLADFDTLSLSNLNRIRGTVPQLGMKKTDLAGIKISEFDPYIEQVHINGVGPEQVEAITAFGPDIIFDEVDDLAAKALLRQIAAQLKVPLVMATDVDDKSIIDIERHDLGPVKPFNGRLNSADIEAMLAGNLSPQDRFKIVAKLTGLTNASFRLLASTRDPSLAGKLSQLGATASEGGALSTRVTRAILSGQKVPSGRHIESQSKTLKLRNQTSPAEALRILKSLRQN
ncbi:MAG: UBA/THIF-type binding protein [Candidatus Saccharibacteria bacterium]|nr:UBA/THIF-type binding protein [Candidatus Saccharibacteria bacterium]